MPRLSKSGMLITRYRTKEEQRVRRRGAKFGMEGWTLREYLTQSHFFSTPEVLSLYSKWWWWPMNASGYSTHQQPPLSKEITHTDTHGFSSAVLAPPPPALSNSFTFIFSLYIHLSLSLSLWLAYFFISNADFFVCMTN